MVLVSLAPLMALCQRQEGVDVFIGTGGEGHTTPGATRPFGLVTVGPSSGVRNDWRYCSGYHYESLSFKGLTHTALSGTGLGDLGDLLATPICGGRILDGEALAHDRECATPGLYVLNFDDCSLEATATKRTGLIRVTCKTKPCGYVLDASWGQNSKTLRAEVSVSSENMIIGFRESAGFGRRKGREARAKGRKVFFACHASDGEASVISKDKAQFLSTSSEAVMRCGLSATNTDQALKNLREETDPVFENAVKDAMREWRRLLFEDVKIVSSSATLLRTALYHTLVAPNIISDVDGLAPSAFGPLRGTYYSTLSTWDTFRTQAPWLTLFAPDVARDIANTMVNYALQKKRLPKWLLFDKETDVMIAYHGVSIVADALLKNLIVSKERAYEAIVTTVDDVTKKEPAAQFHAKGLRLPSSFGPETVPTGLEIAVDDTCAARALGLDFLQKRSQMYSAYFDHTTGYFKGQETNTSTFDPLEFHYANRPNARDFTEGSALQYLFVPGLVDVRGLSRLLGGRHILKQRLDLLFDDASERLQPGARDVTGCVGQCCVGNEVVHHAPYLYSKIGLPHLTQQRLHELLLEKPLFTDGPEGLPGNDDAGQLSAWYLVNGLLGLYPTDPCGQTWDIGRPLVDAANLTILSNRLVEPTNSERDRAKILRIVAHDQGPTQIYIRKILLDGKPYHRNSIDHHTLLNGPLIEFFMVNAERKPSKKSATDGRQRRKRRRNKNNNNYK